MTRKADKKPERMILFQVYIPPKLYVAIRQESRRRDTSMAAILRQHVAKALKVKL